MFFLCSSHAKIQKKGSEMYKFCLELKKICERGRSPLQTPPPTLPPRNGASRGYPVWERKSSRKKMGGGGIIKLDSTIYTPLGQIKELPYIFIVFFYCFYMNIECMGFYFVGVMFGPLKKTLHSSLLFYLFKITF